MPKWRNERTNAHVIASQCLQGTIKNMEVEKASNQDRAKRLPFWWKKHKETQELGEEDAKSPAWEQRWEIASKADGGVKEDEEEVQQAE